jgi:hypothetical protein
MQVQFAEFAILNWAVLSHYIRLFGLKVLAFSCGPVLSDPRRIVSVHFVV